MNHGTLISHVGTDIVTRAQLLAVATPEPTGTFRPIPHFELIDKLDRVLNQCSMFVRREQFALKRDGAVLFGILDLTYRETKDGMAVLGLRTANNKSMSLQICAGLSVSVCENLVFRGDLIALRRRHTSGLNLHEELALSVIRFQDHFGQLTHEIDGLKKWFLSDDRAKVLIHDVFAQNIMPVRFLPEVSKFYFDPPIRDFQPRTAWSLHNAFSAAAKHMPLSTRFLAIQRLGKFFGMSSDSAEPKLLPSTGAED